MNKIEGGNQFWACINDEIFEYDGCSEKNNTDFYSPEDGWKPIGKGYVVDYDYLGNMIFSEKEYYFFVRN